MKKLSFLISCLIIHSASHSAPMAIVDVYGSHLITSSQITAEHRSAIGEIDHAAQHGQSAPNAVKKIIKSIESKGHFSYVNLSPIRYQHDPHTYITIDLVETKDQHRLTYFRPTPTDDIPDTHHLIQDWLTYEKIGFELVFKTKHFPPIKHCPAHHCLFGFDHPQLRPYEKIFSRAEADKTNLILMAQNDKNETKRAAAVYLLAHIKNKNTLISALLPSIHDSSALVRNNAMRVLGATLSQGKIPSQLPIQDIIQAADYPTTTDRNKALYILWSLARHPQYAHHIKQNAGKQLINTLKLQQPDNHDFSYYILKEISGHHYGERDYDAWQKWLS